MKNAYGKILLTALMLGSLMGCKSDDGMDGGYTLLVLPSQFSSVQLGHDLAEREALLLMSYQPGSQAGDAFLHAWTGKSWVTVPDARYRDGNFAKTSPSRTIVVGESNDLTAGLIGDASAWCDEVLNVESAETAELVNAVGRILVFNDQEWEWYAARYQLKLEDMNSGRRTESWYDQNASQVVSVSQTSDSEMPPVEAMQDDVIPVSVDDSGSFSIDSDSL